MIYILFTLYPFIKNCLICSIYRGGGEISKQPFHDPVFDPEKIKKVTEAPGYKKYREDKQSSERTKKLSKALEDDWQEHLKEEGYNLGFNNPQAIRVRNPNIEKYEAMSKLKETQDKEELAKEKVRVEWGLPKITEKG